MSHMNKIGYDGMSLRYKRAQDKFSKALEYRSQIGGSWAQAAEFAGLDLRTLHQMKATYGIN